MKHFRLPILPVLVISAGFATCAAEPFAANFPPELNFVETYDDKVHSVTEDGVTTFDTVPKAKLTISVRCSMQGFDPSTINRETPVSLQAGDLSIDAKLGDDPSYSIGKSGATIALMAEDLDSGDLLKVGEAVLKWSAAELTVNITVSDAPDDYAVAAPDFTLTDDPAISFVDTATLLFGGRTLQDRNLYISGTASAETVTAGKGDDAEELDLSHVRLSGDIDSQPPTINVVQPGKGATLRNAPLTVSGTASDNVGVSSIAVRLDGGELVAADFNPSTGAWSLPEPTLAIGANTIQVLAIDENGNEQRVAQFFNFLPLTTLTVSAAGSGSGTVSSSFFAPLQYFPGSNSTRSSEQEQTASLSVTATPAQNTVFDGWTSNFPLHNPAALTLNFTVQPDMILTAHFAPNPNADKAGGYYGLVQSDDPNSRGSFQLTLDTSATFTGRVRVGRIRVPFVGSFNSAGIFSRTFVSRGLSYEISLALDVLPSGATEIRGTLSGGVIHSQLVADLVIARSNGVKQSGIYNALLLPGAESSDSSFPVGIGYGRINVRKTGSAIFIGKLGDGTTVTFGAPLSTEGVWSIFAPLYGRRGSILGRLSFDLEGDPEVSGTFDWFSPDRIERNGVIRKGFSGPTVFAGARYTPPTVTSAFFTEPGGTVLFSIDAPAVPIDSFSALASETLGFVRGSHLIAFDSTRQVQCRFKPASGLFGGSFFDATQGKRIRFRGVLVTPKVNMAGGLFVRGDGTGAVRITAREN